MAKMKINEIEMIDRFRQEFGDIEELAQSIEEHGLIHPPVVQRDGTLIAGERRFRALKLLGREEIEVRILEDMPELERREIELEENLHRKQFTWSEEVRAKEEIHRIKQLQHGAKVKGHESDGWGVEDTAGVLDESLGTISQDIKLAQALNDYPELEKCKNKSTAWKELKRIEEQETLEKMAELVGDSEATDLYQLENTDAVEWMENQPDESFDLVLADPPWGIGMDTKSRMSRDGFIEYDDDIESALSLIDASAKEFYRILKPDRHVYVYFGIANYQIFRDILEDAGFSVCPIPVIYNKNRGGSAAKGKTFPNAYETIFHCWKGSRKLKTTHHNVFTEKRPEGIKRIHSAQKPIEMQRSLVEASTDPGERVLVPFMGSGSGVVASVRAKREVVGIEKSDKNYASAVDWIDTRLKEEAL